MKRLAVVALMVAGVALPACAQRHSAGGGGFSGHSAPAARSGFRSAAPARGPIASRPPAMRPAPGMRSGAPIMGARQGGFNGRPHRRPYISPYRPRYPYLVAPWGGWIGPGYLGYPDALDYDDSDQSQAAASPDNGGYDNGYDNNGYGSDNSSMAPPQRWPALGPYAPPANLAQPSAATSQSQQAITLVFNDGRPPLKIFNYLLTPTTLFVQDGNNREIPLSQLDLTATARVNEDAGVEFRLPKALD